LAEATIGATRRCSSRAALDQIDFGDISLEVKAFKGLHPGICESQSID
tara:strand:- start:5465 stop:5608 length:144 start_codon:yes stop_codon:yes gene_type:complete